MKRVSADTVVMVELTGTVDSGEVFDSTEGVGPLKLHIGRGRLPGAVEEALLDLGEGEMKTFTVAAANAFGPRDETLEREISRSALPLDYQPQLGDILAAETEGIREPVKVKRFDEQTIVLDLNHPLAGENLTYRVKILEVRSAGGDPESVD